MQCKYTNNESQLQLTYKRSWNIISQRMLFSDFFFFFFFFCFAVPFSRTNPEELTVLMSVLGGAGGSWLFANYRPEKKIPSVFLLGLGAARPTQMLMRGETGATAWCLHCDPRNVPSKRILRQRESLRGFRSHGTVLKQRVFTRGREFTMKMSNLLRAAASFSLSLSLHKEPVARLQKSLLSPF